MDENRIDEIDKRVVRLEVCEEALKTLWKPKIEEDIKEQRIDIKEIKNGVFELKGDMAVVKDYVNNQKEYNKWKNMRAAADPVPDEEGTLVEEIYERKIPVPNFNETDTVKNNGTYIKVGGGIGIVVLIVTIILILKQYGII